MLQQQRKVTLCEGKLTDTFRYGATENEIVGLHHQINGHEFEQTLGDCEGQGSLACCTPWGHKEQDTTEQLNKKCQLNMKSKLK